MSAAESIFNWSQLDQYALSDYFYQLHDKIVGRELTVKELHGIFYRHARRYLPIRVSKKYDSIVEKRWVYVGGCYYSTLDEENKPCIELVFCYNPNTETILYNSRRFRRTCNLIADTLLHEIIHMRQFRRREFKELPSYASTALKTRQREEQRYLGSSDEVDAYSFNIACELIRIFSGNQKQAERYLSRRHTTKSIKSPCLKLYLKAFNWDYNHKIIKRLKSKVIRYLPYAVIGKPYRNKDWICY